MCTGVNAVAQRSCMSDTQLCSLPRAPAAVDVLYHACSPPPRPLHNTHTAPDPVLPAACCRLRLWPRTPTRQGRNVVLESKYGSPKIVNDGVTIAREVELEDPVENIGAKLVRQAAARTNDTAGDGTTTATILSAAFIAEGLKIVAAGEAAAAAGGRGQQGKQQRQQQQRQAPAASHMRAAAGRWIINRCRQAGRQGGGNWQWVQCAFCTRVNDASVSWMCVVIVCYHPGWAASCTAQQSGRHVCRCCGPTPTLLALTRPLTALVSVCFFPLSPPAPAPPLLHPVPPCAQVPTLCS